MDLKRYNDSPVTTIISFHKMIEHVEKAATNGSGFGAQKAQQLLQLIAPYPILREGTTDPSALAPISNIITELLAELFPALLTNNEIKAVTVPFQNVLLNASSRLQRILKAAGPAFDMVIRNFNDHQFYVNTCCLILNQHYGTNLNFGRSLLYDIPDAQGVMKHYRILYNTDFIELAPTDKAVKITQEDIELLRDSFDNIEVWKRYFPRGSWSFKGFAIMNLFDTTAEHAVSALKGSLLGATDGEDLKDKILKVFRSIYKIPELKVGFTSYNEAENKFSPATFNSKLNSYLLKDGQERGCAELSRLIQQDKYSVISDVDKLLQKEPANKMALLLQEQHIRSVVLAPVVKNGIPLGVLEDKAHIKNTTERLTTAGKIAIVYTSHEEEVEYLRYIHFLQGRQLLEKQIELVDVEDLQGVSGLKAIRVIVKYNNYIHMPALYSYEDMTEEN